MHLLQPYVFKETSFSLEYQSHLNEKQVYCLESNKNDQVCSLHTVYVDRRDWVGPNDLWRQVPRHLCPRVVCLLSLCSARADAVIWGMDVFINRLIEYYFFARNFCLDSNLKFSIYFFLTAWHDVKQNNCNRDPQIANNNKKRSFVLCNKYSGVLCERRGEPRRGYPKLVAFLSKTASSLLGTCTLLVPHIQTIMSLLMRPNECFVMLNFDASLFADFCCKFNNEATFRA